MVIVWTRYHPHSQMAVVVQIVRTTERHVFTYKSFVHHRNKLKHCPFSRLGPRHKPRRTRRKSQINSTSPRTAKYSRWWIFSTELREPSLTLEKHLLQICRREWTALKKRIWNWLARIKYWASTSRTSCPPRAFSSRRVPNPRRNKILVNHAQQWLFFLLLRDVLFSLWSFCNTKEIVAIFIFHFYMHAFAMPNSN